MRTPSVQPDSCEKIINRRKSSSQHRGPLDIPLHAPTLLRLSGTSCKQQTSLNQSSWYASEMKSGDPLIAPNFLAPPDKLAKARLDLEKDRPPAPWADILPLQMNLKGEASVTRSPLPLRVGGPWRGLAGLPNTHHMPAGGGGPPALWRREPPPSQTHTLQRGSENKQRGWKPF